jgi:hypothetical protein
MMTMMMMCLMYRCDGDVSVGESDKDYRDDEAQGVGL